MSLRVWWGGWQRSRAVVGCLLATLLLGGMASAQTVYRWEDERGVVHFSDAPPRGAKNVQSRNMPRAPKPAVRGAVDASAPDEDGLRTADGKEAGATAGAPARVEIKAQDATPVGDDTMEFSGEVENVGGSPASDIVVLIEVTETNQGAHCLSEEADVSPSSLAPGEKGTFSLTLSNPCFFGPISTTVRPEWE